MKKRYEINIAHRGAVNTITNLTKKEKNNFLVNYFTQGNGRVWGIGQYHLYLDRIGVEKKKKLSFEKFILKLLKDKKCIQVHSRNEIILIREKIFEKLMKNA